VIAAQVVEHVIDVHRLIHRPRRAGLAVGEVRIRQIDGDLAAALRIGMTPRQPQRVPQIRAEQIVDARLRHLELRAARHVIRPEPQRRLARATESIAASTRAFSASTIGDGSFTTN
jgi:hypothetical protein